MTVILPKAPVVEALTTTWGSLRQLLGDLDDAEWAAPSPLPGWDVRANVAHMVGTESMLLGDPQPETDVDVKALPHVRNDIGAFNEVWIVTLRDASPAEMLERFDDVTSRRTAVLEAMGQDEWDKEGFTPAGMDSYGRFMRIRIFDCWMHEQDIRDATGRPGHESGPDVALTLDEMSGAMGFVVGKRAGAPAGSSVTFDLTGESGRSIHVAVGERAQVVDALDGPATATLTMPVGTFTRVAGGRLAPDAARSDVKFGGDEALASAVLANLNYTI